MSSSSYDTEDASTDYNLNLYLDNDKRYKVKTFEEQSIKATLPSNSISTSKYTWYSCVPKILIEQFSKMANIYFLIVAVLQSINSISISGGKPLILIPLLFVIFINGLKNFFEDYKRKKSDTEENNREVWVYANSETNKEKSEFVKMKWKDIKPGDIVRVTQDEYFPADILLISSSEESHCYVETKNLDGETNLKYKFFNPNFCKEFDNEERMKYLTVQINCKPPDDNIYDFEGRMRLVPSNHNSSLVHSSNHGLDKFNNTRDAHLVITSNENYNMNNNDLNENNLNLDHNNNNNNNNNASVSLIPYSGKKSHPLYKEEFHLDKNPFLLRGCSLKQTDWIIGIVIYTGHFTKIMKNSPRPRNKVSKVEKLMHKQIIFIMVLQIFLSIIATVLLLIWLDKNKTGLQVYIFSGTVDDKVNTFIINGIFRIGTWILIFTNFVPISLLVTMEMIKYVQGMFITWDADIYCKSTKQSAFVQTSTLNEELGQVSYIFSDKTGTLTRNHMEFKKAAIGSIIYGDNEDYSNAVNNYDTSSQINTLNNINSNLDKINKAKNITNVNFKDKNYVSHLTDPLHENSENMKLFLLNLMLCHSANTNYSSIKTQNIDGLSKASQHINDKERKSYSSEFSLNSEQMKELKIQASSPDEIALINFAKYSSYDFIFKNDNNDLFVKINNINFKYKLLHTIEYSSERKRMSVIVKSPDNRFYLLTKGADSFILPLVTANTGLVKIVKDALYDFAKEGLRTLTIAYKELSEKEVEEINEKKNTILRTQGSKGLDILYQSIEKDFYLLGCTAIEDHLQENVSSSLKKFISTGIKIWMLTGDKIDTAKSIAFSCGLMNHDHVIFELEENSAFNIIENSLFEFNRLIKANPENKHSLVLGMDEISKIMGDDSLKNSFYELSSKCDSVLCCRVTPKQKAQMVQLYKKKNPDKVCLAIGDGANDVNMITSAHIGVGILGVEGLQAARASDYAIGQFSYLEKLLFVHGRESYRKNTFVVCYNFYKNALFVMPQFWFGCVSLFSGQTLYDPWIYQLFNIVFTSWPIIWFGCMDSEIEHKELLRNTNYYKQGMKNFLFNTMRFWKYVVVACIQSLLIFLFCFYSNSYAIDQSGRNVDLWLVGSICYHAVVIIVNIRILTGTKSHTVFSFWLVILTILSYNLTVLIMSHHTMFENFNNFKMMNDNLKTHFLIIVLCSACIIFDIGVSKLPMLFVLVQKPYDPRLKNADSISDDESDDFIQERKKRLEILEETIKEEISHEHENVNKKKKNKGFSLLNNEKEEVILSDDDLKMMESRKTGLKKKLLQREKEELIMRDMYRNECKLYNNLIKFSLL